MIAPLLFADYGRISSSKQKANHSLETQSRYNRKIIDKYGGTLVMTCIDEGISGYHKNIAERKEFQRLLSAILEGKVNCIAFYDESRLTRKIYDFYEEVVKPIVETGVKVRFFKSSTGAEWSPDSEEAKNNLIQAYRESAKKAVIARHNQEEALKDRLRPGSKLPFGVKAIVGNTLIPDDNFPMVLFIFELASFGYSERAIANCLNELDLTQSINGTQKSWSHTSVHYILHNTIYIGQGVWNRRLSKYNSAPRPKEQMTFFATYQPIVPNYLWNLAHAEIKRKGNDVAIRTNSTFLLSSIAQCSHCNGFLLAKNSLKSSDSNKLTTKKGNPLRYYYCPTCEYRIDASLLDSVVLGRINSEIGMRIDKGTILKTFDKLERELKRKIEIEEKDLNHFKYQRSKLQSYSDLLGEEKNKLIQGKADLVVNQTNQKMIELRKSLQHVMHLNEEKTAEVIANRIKSGDKLVSHIEQRYLIISTVEELKISQSKSNDSGFQIDLLAYRDVPIPNLAT